jgi:response regulator RpfG family c-di-GMP phosphodiesterase
MHVIPAATRGASNLEAFGDRLTLELLGSFDDGPEWNLQRDCSDMPTTRHCLLIVDDEPDVCDSVQDWLRREFRVLKAHSAEEGYRLMQEEEVHIVMSDQRMPQITGIELLAKVKARHPQAIRMLFTGFADLESVIAAINQGHVYQFLKKPWQPEELLAAVRQAAIEHDRLETLAIEREHLLREVTELHDRVTALETEVRRLQAAPRNASATATPAAPLDSIP